jgi:hypothetical protein
MRPIPSGVLFAFGIAMLVCGFVYRTPIPVEPMKAAGAIATTQGAQTLTLTPATAHGASLVTGLIWLVLGLTGTANRVANLVKRPIVVGIILGLGLGFMIEGAKMMSENWWIGGATLLGTSLLLTNRVVYLRTICAYFDAHFEPGANAWFTVAGGILGAMAFGYLEPALRPFLLAAGPASSPSMRSHPCPSGHRLLALRLCWFRSSHSWSDSSPGMTRLAPRSMVSPLLPRSRGRLVRHRGSHRLLPDNEESDP